MTSFVSWLYRGDYSECLYSGHVELDAFACKYAIQDLKPVETFTKAYASSVRQRRLSKWPLMTLNE